MNNAGLPGTGLGGVFYLLLAFWMPVHELVATARGRSSRERWRVVGGQFALACGIVAAVAVAIIGLRAVPGSPSPLGASALPLGLAVLAAPMALAVLVVVLRVWARLGSRPGPDDDYVGRHRRADEDEALIRVS